MGCQFCSDIQVSGASGHHHVIGSEIERETEISVVVGKLFQICTVAPYNAQYGSGDYFVVSVHDIPFYPDFYTRQLERVYVVVAACIVAVGTEVTAIVVHEDYAEIVGSGVYRSSHVLDMPVLHFVLIGEKYVHTRQFHTKTKGAQEAHEAIRPTYMSNEAIEGERGEVRLYNLIWKRTLASQMEDATLEKTTATISISGQAETFTAIGETVIFDGFLRVYKESYDDENEPENDSRLLPNLKVGQTLFRKEITATQRFTLPPARYTEASLVRKLEELGIGRPSTYAPTISTIQRRGYVVKGDKEGTERPYKVLQLLNGNVAETVRTEITGSEKNKLIPTDVGIVVNDFLMKYFPIIMDYNFTAKVEKEFDEVAEGDCTWTDMMEHFYKDFHPLVTETKEANSSKAKGERILGTDPASGRQVAVKVGRFGPVVQIGIAGEAEKPRFAPLRKEYSMETITLEQALDLFKLPRTLGEWEGKPVVVGVGRFGSYIRHDNKFVSLPKETDLMAMTLEEAEQIILNKREAEAKKIIREFADQPELKVLNGRFGPYISYKKENYKIPKGIEAETLDAEACMQLIQLQKSKEEIRKPKAITVKATSKKKAK